MRESRLTTIKWLFITLFSFQVAYLSAAMSVTCDEIGHIAGGLYIWDFGRFDVYRVNPPLVRATAAFPAYCMNANREYRQYAEGPVERVEWAIGLDLMAANGAAFEWYVVWGRWATIPLTVAGAFVVCRWSSELYGSVPVAKASHHRISISICGIVSLALYCCCPNLVAWSATFTPDAAAASLGVIATHSFWKWLRSPTFWNAVLAGGFMGLAELAKTSWIILFPMWPVLWVMWRISERKTTTDVLSRDSGLIKSDPTASLRHPSVMQLVTILCIAVYTINCGYGFEGTGTRIKNFVFVSRALAGSDSRTDNGSGGNRFANSWIGEIPVPLPFNYVRGIDLQKVDFEVGKPSYLRGEWSPRGWWYYYIFATTLKVPLGTWVLGAIVLLMKLRSGRSSRLTARAGNDDALITWRDEAVLLAPAVALFTLVSSQSGFSRYFRYVLPCLPFVFVFLGQAGRYLENTVSNLDVNHSVAGTCQKGFFRGHLQSFVVCVALLWAMLSHFSIYPHSLSYFNEVAGGPMNGHLYLIDANIDWGQDMYYLRNWIKEHPNASPLSAALVSFVRLSDHQLKAMAPAESPMPGWYAMSVHRIRGEHGIFKFFLEYTPVATAGYSVYIYHVTPQDADRIRKKLGYPEVHNVTRSTNRE